MRKFHFAFTAAPKITKHLLKKIPFCTQVKVKVKGITGVCQGAGYKRINYMCVYIHIHTQTHCVREKERLCVCVLYSEGRSEYILCVV